MTVAVRDTGEEQVGWVNATGLPAGMVQGSVQKVARELASWVDGVRDAKPPSWFNRQAYLTPENPYQQMRIARDAVENDDIVGGVCDVTEGLMLQTVKWESPEADDADVFNQINRDLNLDEFVRIWHREEYTYSQVVIGMWWGRRTYKVRGKTKNGAKRRKSVEVYCPVALTFLNPLKVVPLSPGPFGQDRLAWSASKAEMADYTALQDGRLNDPVMREFFAGVVTGLPKAEEEELAHYGVDPKRLILLNPNRVFRSCRTKVSYHRFPQLRLKSLFPLLDLKQQLIEADRVNLVGAANYILLVKKGTKEDPADQQEIDNLREGMTVLAKLPVIVGDHRLEIEIITPEQEYVLSGDKYDVLDRRILNRALGSLTVTTSGQRNESTLTVARGVARLLESRRLLMKRVLEQQVARAVVDHPANDGAFNSEPNLTFSPRNVQLDNDSQMLQAVLSARTQRELSRESYLEVLGFDQEMEAQRREFEEDSGFDDIFQSHVPFDSPANGQNPNGDGAQDNSQNGNNEPPQASGSRGGRPVGGGKSRQSPQRQAKPRTPRGNQSTKE